MKNIQRVFSGKPFFRLYGWWITDLLVYCICVLSFGLLSDHEPCTTLKLLGMKNSSFVCYKQNYIIVSIRSYSTNLIRMVSTYIMRLSDIEIINGV